MDFSLVPAEPICLLLPLLWWLFPNSSLLKWRMFSQAQSLPFLQRPFLQQVSLNVHSFSIQNSFFHTKSVSGQKMQISGISSAFSGLGKSSWNCDFVPTLMELLPTCRSLCAPGTVSLVLPRVDSLCRTSDGTGNVWISTWRPTPSKDSTI